MRDDDDLPVLNAVVRDGDAAVIRSVRLGLALAALPGADVEAAAAQPDTLGSRTRRARGRTPPNAAVRTVTDGLAAMPERRPRTRGGPFGTLTGFGVDERARELTETPDVDRIDLGHAPVGIDASRDRDGRRASRLLADVSAALDESAFERSRDPVDPVVDRTSDPAADSTADPGYGLDDTWPLDAVPAATARRVLDRHVAAPAALAATLPPDAAVDLDALVERIVDRHVAALRRDVRDALERALGHADD